MSEKANSRSNTGKINSSSFSFLFSIAAVWFGIHVGGGFASGSQTMNFFVKFGWTGVFFPAISIIIVALTYREQLIIANHYRVFDYNSMSHKLYEPFDKVLSPIYEIFNIMAGFLAISASIAGAAALINEMLGVPYMVCIIGLGTLVLAMSIYGSALVRKISTLLTVIIVVSFVVICTKGISMQTTQLSTIVAEKQQITGSFGQALWQAMAYAGFQCFAFMGFLSACSDLKTKSNTTKAMILGFMLNAVMISLTAILMVAWLPQLGKETLPILAITKQMGGGFTMILYSSGLLAAFLSTAVGATFGTVTRFTAFRERTSKTGIFANEKTFSILVGVIVMVISVAISTFGLTKIVAVGYGYAGYAGVFLVIIPTLTYGHWKNKKFEKEHPDFDSQFIEMEN